MGMGRQCCSFSPPNISVEEEATNFPKSEEEEKGKKGGDRVLSRIKEGEGRKGNGRIESLFLFSFPIFSRGRDKPSTENVQKNKGGSVSYQKITCELV